MASKMTVGCKMPDFTYDTAFETGLRLSETVKKAKKTALVFLRFYGCPVCQFDIHNYAEAYEKLTADDGQLLVVLQSQQSTITSQMDKDTLPFDLVCDPDQTLYKLLAIGSQTEPLDFVNLKDSFILNKLNTMTAAGYDHVVGQPEGNENQLPAAFVVTPDLKVTYVHYGTWPGDAPSVEVLAEHLK
jgi:peroxiredoxin